MEQGYYNYRASFVDRNGETQVIYRTKHVDDAEHAKQVLEDYKRSLKDTYGLAEGSKIEVTVKFYCKTTADGGWWL